MCYLVRIPCRSVLEGKRFLKSIQRPDGSWYGSWGVCFTYGKSGVFIAFVVIFQVSSHHFRVFPLRTLSFGNLGIVRFIFVFFPYFIFLLFLFGFYILLFPLSTCLL